MEKKRNQLLSFINKFSKGEPFSAREILLENKKQVRLILKRLTDQKVLVRLMRGVYY